MSFIDDLAKAEDLVSPGISTCPGCPAELALRTVLKYFGKNTIVGVPPGCMAGAGGGGWDKLSGLKVPCTMPLLDNVASCLSGIKRAYNRIDPDVNVISFAGDGATADAGFQCLSAAVERKDNIIYVCYDNEAYMNTGFQKSGTTPQGAHTSTTPVGQKSMGKSGLKKDVAMLMAIQDAAYVATLSTAHMQDFVNKLKKALTVKDGLVYLHIFIPCPTGWGFDPSQSIKYARRAIEAKYFLLYEYEQGNFTISGPTKNIKIAKDIKEFTSGQKRFKHLGEEDLGVIKSDVSRKWQLLQKLANDLDKQN